MRVSLCHCLECQRRTGSVFAVQARFSRDAVAITGPSKEYVRIGDSGEASRYHFCPDCGSTVFYGLVRSPDIVAIPVGAFADPGFPAPAMSIYEQRKHGWVLVPADIEHLD